MKNGLHQKIGLTPFSPLPLINGGRAQTLAGYYFPYNPFLNEQNQHVVPLPDGDKIALIENQPAQWNKSQRIILLVHGLTGSHRSKYVIRAAQLFTAQGYLVFRMNLRGCGAGKGLAKHLYHSGRSEDTRAVLGWLKARFPESPVTQIGFSLGANITLKMGGEERDQPQPSGNVDSLIAVSPPLDLYATVQRIIQRDNVLFDRYFVEGLLRDIDLLHAAYPELPPAQFPAKLNVLEFDNIYTAPRSGFKDAIDYYTQCSAGQFIDRIELPTFILHAEDDPLVDNEAFLHLTSKKNRDVMITPNGGHVGWLGRAGESFSYRWLDHAILKWVDWFDRNK